MLVLFWHNALTQKLLFDIFSRFSPQEKQNGKNFRQTTTPRNMYVNLVSTRCLCVLDCAQVHSWHQVEQDAGD